MNTHARVYSVRVGTPAAIDDAVPWTTAFYKTEVHGLVRLGFTNLDGDRQADLTVHGGVDKAVCVYPQSHYTFWAHELGRNAGPGWFGENLTLSNQTETSVCIGDIYRVGTAVVQVSQPRGPCWKLARRWRQPDLPKRVIRSGRSGWYLRVLQEGAVAADCPLTLESRSWPQWTIARVNELTYARPDLLASRSERAALAECEALADQWRASLLRG
jgi:MOSC domain-containing protein YiiM